MIVDIKKLKIKINKMKLNKEFFEYMENRNAPVYRYTSSDNSFLNIDSYSEEYEYYCKNSFIIEDYRFGYIIAKKIVSNADFNFRFKQQEEYWDRPHKDNFKLNKTYNFLGINKSVYE